MELNMQKQTITINEIVCNEVAEQAIECDAMLPDYCPDIAKILKCAVNTGIGSAAQNGDRIVIEGTAQIKVYYQSEGEGVRRADYKVPFTKTVELSSKVASPVITVTPSVDYVNCRAVSGRRIDVRGSLSLAVKVSERRSEPIISDATGGGLQLRQQMINSTELSGQAESSFAVTENLELAYGKPAIGSILRSDCTVNVHEAKLVSGKVVAKADLMVHITYLPQDDTNRLEMMDYTLPISQIIDAEGTGDDSICDVSMQPLVFELRAKADDTGEYRMVSLETQLRAIVVSHRKREVPVTTDCYSTMYESSCKQQQIPFIRLEKILRETVMHRAALELPEGVSEVLDVWCDVEAMNWKQNQESLVVTLRMTVCMFARTENGEGVSYFEQANDLVQNIPVACPDNGKIIFEPNAHVISCGYSLSGEDKIEIRCEINLRGCIYCTFAQPTICEINVDEASPRQREKNRLFLYYADPDESVWDIAKRYNTSANAIWEENDIQNDILSARRMLLIPLV